MQSPAARAKGGHQLIPDEFSAGMSPRVAASSRVPTPIWPLKRWVVNSTMCWRVARAMDRAPRHGFAPRCSLRGCANSRVEESSALLATVPSKIRQTRGTLATGSGRRYIRSAVELGAGPAVVWATWPSSGTESVGRGRNGQLDANVAELEELGGGESGRNCGPPVPDSQSRLAENSGLQGRRFARSRGNRPTLILVMARTTGTTVGTQRSEERVI